MAQSTGKRRASVGVLFWIAFILLVLVIFLANRSNIEQVLETTGIVDVIRDRVADDPESGAPEDGSGGPEDPVGTNPRTVERPASDNPSVAVDTGTDTDSPNPVVIEPEDRTEPPATTVQPDSDTGDRTGDDAPPVAEEDRPRDGPDQPSDRDVTRPNQRMAALYFIKVTDDGRTYPQRVVRAISYDQSPLTETIRALISGPTGSELDEGLLNLIPSGTELISAHVADGVAYLNFNRSFRFNPMGAEGTVAQLQQIIYSSTEFSTVSRVQFLVEGEQLDYVGGDGIYIGEPLGRDAFSS
jgi:spore germination protein GerM